MGALPPFDFEALALALIVRLALLRLQRISSRAFVERTTPTPPKAPAPAAPPPAPAQRKAERTASPAQAAAERELVRELQKECRAQRKSNIILSTNSESACLGLRKAPTKYNPLMFLRNPSA